MSTDPSPPEPLAYQGRRTVHIIGSILLTACLLTVILGLTLLSKQLDGVRYLLYWAGCFLLAFACIAVAGYDMLMVRRALKQTKRELFQREFLSAEFSTEVRNRIKNRRPDDRA